MKTLLATAAALTLIGAAHADPVVAVVDGPPMSRATVEAERAAAVAFVTDRLVDPDSAEFKWTTDPAPTTDWRIGMLGRKHHEAADFLCGRVNSRNRMGGYSGYAWFLVAIEGDRVIDSQIDDATDDYPVAEGNCAKLGF